MALSWNEIKDRAIKFSKEWAETFNENADAKPFLIEFFNVFGIIQRKVSTFEHRVKKLDDHDGYIDMLWKGNLLVEMKSKGKDLDKAYSQAREYLDGLKQIELPKYVLICDFERFRLYDLEDETTIEFQLADLVNNVQHFGFIAGYQKRVFKEQDPVNIQAAELMGKLHDKLKSVGYVDHPLELYLVRLLFILFADDTTIFDKDIFIDFIESKTSEDGSDLAARLGEVFYILNTPFDKRLKNIDDHLNRFPYVNGRLFEEYLPPASFDSTMRNNLIECCYLDWGKISPAIFGSMFQSVMNPEERRNLGAHYTSEKNILKLIKPLFLDELWSEFESVRTNRNKLIEFHIKLSKLKFLDPACGCGNFLVITYRELRLLELEILRELYKYGELAMDINDIILLDVDMMYGIEYEEFPARIAEVAMWLIDHQMNMLVSQEFGQYFSRLPLKKSANILNADALEMNWEDLIPKDRLSYILGNPPFSGSNIMKQKQRDQVVRLLNKKSGGGVLDYVAAWYLKAARYIQGTSIKVAFVSTNSITQGEQIGVLWNELIVNYKIKIHFAHRTFKWSNEARGNAAVYVVIVGFAAFDTNYKVIFEYDDIRGEAHELRAKNINAYLTDAKDMLVDKKKKPICNVPDIIKGNYYAKSKGLIVEAEDLEYLLLNEPNAKKWIKNLIGANEFINNKKRYCLWLVDCPPDELRKMPLVMARVNSVKEDRLKSTDKGIKHLPPTRFRETNNPDKCLVIPVVSSEFRNYIPMGFINKNTISTNANLIMPNATIFHFGILQSIMHMTWVKHVCGRLKSDFRYSKDIVYNNYPWPDNPSEKHIKAVEEAAESVLDVRASFLNSSYADLYDPLSMPPALVKAHKALDKAVDLAYRPQPFPNEAKRMEYLFALYEKYTAGLYDKMKKK
jgi:hypothetical protein